MDGVLVAFSVPTGKNRTKSSAFAKAFYGQETSSHHGKYRYRRRGFLDEIPYNKLIRGVIVIQNEDLARVLEFLNQHSANYHTRVVELTEEDRKAMRLTTE
jgi:hypothetical protein